MLFGSVSTIRQRAEQVAELLEQEFSIGLHPVQVATELSQELGIPAYLVGGAVRDLLLTGELEDIDLAVEGDESQFARSLADRLGAEIRLHAEFHTAEVWNEGGLRVDVAATRTETYAATATLPQVEPASIEKDLARRDFSINALAIRLGPEEKGLVDLEGGVEDLEERRLRILHERSFVDDPTRAFRGVRLESRLGLAWEAQTLGALEQALEKGVFDRLSASRLGNEVITLLGQPSGAGESLQRLDELGLLRVLEPHLAFQHPEQSRHRQIDDLATHLGESGMELPNLELWRLRLMNLAWNLAPVHREQLAARIDLSGYDRDLMLGYKERVGQSAEVLEGSDLEPHEAARIMRALASEELVLLAVVGSPEVENWVKRWIEELRGLKLLVSGSELLEQGFEPGPEIGAALDATLDARLDGRITPDEELAFALRYLEMQKSNSESSAKEAK